MNSEFFSVPVPEQPARGLVRVLRGAENLLLALPLFALVALPLIETVLRRFHGGISGSTRTM